MDTVHKDRTFTVFQLAVHTCGYGRQCARRQSRCIGLDILIHKYLLCVYNWKWSGWILSHHPLFTIILRAVTLDL